MANEIIGQRVPGYHPSDASRTAPWGGKYLFPLKVIKLLQQKGITPAELARMSMKEIRETKGFGTATIREIRRVRDLEAALKAQGIPDKVIRNQLMKAHQPIVVENTVLNQEDLIDFDEPVDVGLVHFRDAQHALEWLQEHRDTFSSDSYGRTQAVRKAVSLVVEEFLGAEILEEKETEDVLDESSFQICLSKNIPRSGGNPDANYADFVRLAAEHEGRTPANFIESLVRKEFMVRNNAYEAEQTRNHA